MARKKGKKFMNWIATIVGLIVAIGVGGLFVAGGFTGVVLLSYLPLIVHQIVGWIIVVGSAIKFITDLM